MDQAILMKNLPKCGINIHWYFKKHSEIKEVFTMGVLYNTDFHAWTQEQAALLKSGRLAEIAIPAAFELSFAF